MIYRNRQIESGSTMLCAPKVTPKFVCGKCGRRITIVPPDHSTRRIRAVTLKCRCGAAPVVKLVRLHEALALAEKEHRTEIVVGGGPRARRHGGYPDLGGS